MHQTDIGSVCNLSLVWDMSKIQYDVERIKNKTELDLEIFLLFSSHFNCSANIFAPAKFIASQPVKLNVPGTLRAEF